MYKFIISVPPKTPVLTGFDPAPIGSPRELVCDASQPDAGTITYKWYKYTPPDSLGNTWESKGPIGTSRKYIFSSVPEKQVFHQGGNAESVSGKYKCRATNSEGTRDSEWGDIYVYTPCKLLFSLKLLFCRRHLWHNIGQQQMIVRLFSTFRPTVSG
jgi:hypothetical protein